ncbi:MAG: GNAT family N-acetyltransferase [Erysipelotrichaceae bacterium]
MEVIQATTQADFFALMKLRTEVFITEQKVDPAIEIDDLDQICIHLIAKDNNSIIGTCRIIQDGDYYKIGRVAVSKKYRGQGIGNEMMLAAERFIPRGSTIRVGAQLQALPFYQRLGYTSYGDTFLDAEIEHVMMEKRT